MRTFAFAVAASALLILPLPAVAGPLTDLSSQSVQIGPGGVRVGHDRWDSRRRDVRVHDRYESRGRGAGCRTVTIKERLPGGGVKIVKRREC
jgi:hypothetical protein